MTRRDSYPYSVSTVSARNARDHKPPFGAQTRKIWNVCIFRVSLLKQARLKRTNSNSTCVSAITTQQRKPTTSTTETLLTVWNTQKKNCEGTSGNVFWTKIKAQERASFQNISPTMADFCAVVSTLLFGVSFCLKSGSQVERQKRQKAYLNSKKKKKKSASEFKPIFWLSPFFFLLFCLLSPTAKPGRRLG